MHVVFRLPSFGRVWNDGPRWQSRWGIVCGSFNYYLMQQGIADFQSGVLTNELTVGWWKLCCVRACVCVCVCVCACACACACVWWLFVIITMNSCLCPILATIHSSFTGMSSKENQEDRKIKADKNCSCLTQDCIIINDWNFVVHRDLYWIPYQLHPSPASANTNN